MNSAMPFGNKILATLFHQGELIKINKETLETETLLSGLSCPHGVKPFNENLWTISDTKNNQVLILNQDFVKCDTICENFDWVQDHCHTPKPLFYTTVLFLGSTIDENQLILEQLSKKITEAIPPRSSSKHMSRRDLGRLELSKSGLNKIQATCQYKKARSSSKSLLC